MSDETSLPPSPESSPGSGLEPNVAAGLSCIVLLLGGFVFLLLEKKNEYVRYWAAQSLIVGGVLVAFWIVWVLLVKIFVHIPVLGWLIILLLWLLWVVVALGSLALWIMMLVNSFSGKKWDVPFLAKYVPLVLSKFPTT